MQRILRFPGFVQVNTANLIPQFSSIPAPVKRSSIIPELRTMKFGSTQAPWSCRDARVSPQISESTDSYDDKDAFR